MCLQPSACGQILPVNESEVPARRSSVTKAHSASRPGPWEEARAPLAALKTVTHGQACSGAQRTAPAAAARTAVVDAGWQGALRLEDGLHGRLDTRPCEGARWGGCQLGAAGCNS